MGLGSASHRGPGRPWAKRDLGPLSSGSKDHGTHKMEVKELLESLGVVGFMISTEYVE